MQCTDCDRLFESRVIEYSPMGKSVLSVCPNCARIFVERQIFRPATAAICAQSRFLPPQSQSGISGVRLRDPIGPHVAPRTGESLLRDVVPETIRVKAGGRSYIYAPIAEIDAIADTDVAAD